MLDTGFGGNHIACYHPVSSIQYHYDSLVKKAAWLDLGYYHLKLFLLDKNNV